MAKVAKARIPEIIVNEDGSESDGMYRWGGPKIPFDADRLKKWVDDFNRDYTQDAAGRISMLRDWLTSVISPNVDGPYTQEQTDKIYGRTLVHLRLSTGTGCYAVHAGVPTKGYIGDAIDAIVELNSLEKLIAETPANVDQLVRCSLRAGILIMRAELRATFGPDVIVAKKRRKASAKGGAATKRWNAEIEKNARTIFSDCKRGRMSNHAACVRTSQRLESEHGIIISESTLKRRLKDLFNAKR